jgi:plasmid maintenance system killer protein
MEFDIKDKETIEIYTTGKSSKRDIPAEVAKKLILRLWSLKCAYTNSDITNCRVAAFDGESLRLKDNYRVRVVKYEHHWEIKEIFKEVKK